MPEQQPLPQWSITPEDLKPGETLTIAYPGFSIEFTASDIGTSSHLKAGETYHIIDSDILPVGKLYAAMLGGSPTGELSLSPPREELASISAKHAARLAKDLIAEQTT